MEELYRHQSILLAQVNQTFFRYLYHKISWKDRFVCIKGLRGVGKTTMLLQYLKYDLKDLNKNLYVSLDHPYFYSNSLEDLVSEFTINGGEVLLVDEVHKMANWSRVIKYLYDTYPKLQIVFSSSSALDLLRGEADLSRRVLVYNLGGLSFREFLFFKFGIKHKPYSLSELLKSHVEVSLSLAQDFSIIPAFKEYLQYGYYPFSKGLTFGSFQSRLIQTLETTLNVDMAYINDYSPENTYKIRKLLGVVVASPPFSLNVSSVAEKLLIGRNTVKSYLHAMEKAGVLNFLSKEGKGISILQKPDKIYLENTNLSYAVKPDNNKGSIRETFALNQLIHANEEVHYPKGQADFYLPEHNLLFEIGGPSKKKKQLAQHPNGYVMIDDLESGYLNKVPLYLLGMLY